MADFGDFLGSSSSTTVLSADDPTAEFLAREQAILGADAALFGNELALGIATVAPTSASITSPTPADFGAFSTSSNSITSPPSVVGSTGFQEPTLANFSSPAIPIIPTATGASDIGWGGQQRFASPTMTSAYGGAMTPLGFTNTGVSTTSSIPVPVVPEPEPEVIREWREKFSQTVADRDSNSQTKHEKILADAKLALERFYADYNDQKAKGVQKNREAGAGTQHQEDLTGNVWERVVKQIELTSQPNTSSNPARDAAKKGSSTRAGSVDDKSKDKPKGGSKGRDTARMKELLQSLRKDPNAPGIEA